MSSRIDQMSGGSLLLKLIKLVGREPKMSGRAQKFLVTFNQI